jgi:hypothetical protein
MRDLIWTIIIIWVVFKLVSAFRSISVTKTRAHSNQKAYNPFTQGQTKQKPEGSVTVDPPNTKSGKTPKPNVNDGEYVDFEEIK